MRLLRVIVALLLFLATGHSIYGVSVVSLSILPIAQSDSSLGFFYVPTKTYGDSSFGLTAPSSNSSGAFTYTSSNTSVATISGSTVTIVGAGTSTITATQAASGIYGSTSTTATLTVAKADPVISAMSDLTLNSSEYSEICIAEDSSKCGRGTGLGVSSRFIELPTSNSPGLFSSFTRSNASVIYSSSGTINAIRWSSYYSLQANLTPVYNKSVYPYSSIFPYWGAITSTITVIQEATTNFNSGSVSFTLTLQPENGTAVGKVCYNAGVNINQGNNTYECLCTPDYETGRPYHSNSYPYPCDSTIQ